MKSQKWLTGYFCIAAAALGVIGAVIYYIDPYFHYHYPHTEKYYYELSNERYQNDGIARHFDYDTVITGTSMTEQFKTSEMDAFFGTQSIKVPYSGGSYKEIHDNLQTVLKRRSELKMVVWGLDMNRFLADRDEMRYEAEEYPSYLYNENPLDDVRYLFNRNAMLDVCYILTGSILEMEPGITSFDEYTAWQNNYTYGIQTVCPDGISLNEAGKTNVSLSGEEKHIIQENIQANITSLAEAYPNVTFYLFFTPYSALWWADQSVERQVEAEQYVIELLLEHDNIRLYSFNNRTDITTDLNHYKDKFHYAAWINSLMLRWMYEGEYLLTRENYMNYLEEEQAFYSGFDYESLNGQEDYECDDYAAALLNQELYGVAPLELEALSADASAEGMAGDAPQVFVPGIDEYKYLVFYGRNVEDGQVLVQIFDAQGEVVSELAADVTVDEDSKWHQYLLDISEIKGDVTIRFNGRIVEGKDRSDLSNERDCSNALLRNAYLL